MKLYPVLLNISDKPVMIIGGGDVAFRKAKDLVYAGASITVVSPEIIQDLKDLAQEFPGKLVLLEKSYETGDLEGAHLVFSATDNETTNRRVFKEAAERGIFINSVDNPENCTFFVPSYARRGDLLLAVSTGGASPAMAARLRRLLEDAIPENIEEILEALRGARELLQADKDFQNLDPSARGLLLKKIVQNDELLKKLVGSSKDENLLKSFLKDLK